MSERERDNRPGGHIGRRLRESLERTSDVVVVEREQTVPARPFAAAWVDYREYHAAQRLKSELLRKYRGKALEDVLPGEEVRTARGVCYRIVSRDASRLRTVDSAEASRRILSDLKLLYGVGEVTEAALKRQGVGTIADLSDHPRFGRQAQSILKMVEEGDTAGLLDWIGRWFQKSHPLALFSSGFHREEDFILIDIETLGMFQRPIILLGLARVHGPEIRVEQYLLRQIDEESRRMAELIALWSKEATASGGALSEQDAPPGRLSSQGAPRDRGRPQAGPSQGGHLDQRPGGGHRHRLARLRHTTWATRGRCLPRGSRRAARGAATAMPWRCSWPSRTRWINT